MTEVRAVRVGGEHGHIPGGAVKFLDKVPEDSTSTLHLIGRVN